MRSGRGETSIVGIVENGARFSDTRARVDSYLGVTGCRGEVKR